ncbi:unnamed protein product [Effrenium voratum]|nr:unnamed protein product [Effrenium voratum]
MGQCGCKKSAEVVLPNHKSRSSTSSVHKGRGPSDAPEHLEVLNEAGRFILERTKAKRGEKGTELTWLDFLVRQIWPKVHEALKTVVLEELEPKVQAALPAMFGSLSFKTFNLGPEHPQLMEIGVAHGKQNHYDGLELDVKMVWNCNADIVLEVQGIEIGIEKIRIDGTVRLQLRPLMPQLPTVGGVQITMMSPPNISWSFRGLLAALQVDVVSRVMRQVVADQISEMLVVPNLIFIHWLDSASDVDLEVLQFPHPECVVRLCIKEARDLRGSDWNYFGFNGTSDPYVSVHLGSHLWHTPQKTRTRNPKWGHEGYHDFFVYTPSQFVKVDIYDSDIGPGTDDHLGCVEGLTVEALLERPIWWWPLQARKKPPEPKMDSSEAKLTDRSDPETKSSTTRECGEVLIEAHFLELRASLLGDVPKPMGKADAVAFAFIDLRSLRGLQPNQAHGATITFKLEGQTYKSRPASYQGSNYGSALTQGAQRLVEHLYNIKGRSVEEIMKISGLSKEQVYSVVHARPSFTTKWHLPFTLPIRDLNQAQLDISLGTKRPNMKVLASLKSPLHLKQALVDTGRWQLDKALLLERDPKLEGTNLVQETLELSLRITLRTLAQQSACVF